MIRNNNSGTATLWERWIGFVVHSVRGRIIVGVILLHGILLSLVVWDMVSRQRQFLQEQLAEQGSSLAQTLAVNAPTWLIANDVNGLAELVSGLRSVPHLELALILDQTGRVRATTDPNLFNLVLQDEPSVKLLRPNGPRQIWHDGSVDSVAEITAAGEPIGYVRVILSDAPVSHEVGAVTRRGVTYTLLAMLLGGLVSWLVVRSMTNRLARLSAAADAIAAGNLSVIIDDIDGHDEVAHLTRDFNQMTNALAEEQLKQARSEAALFAEKERAQVTLMSIGDAVVTTDVAGRVEFLNPVAEELTGWTTDEARGMFLDDVFKIINETTRKTVENPIHIVLREGHVVGLANHTVLIRRDGTEMNIEDSAAPIRDREGRISGVVLVFHDVTKAHEMARQMSWAATHDALTGLFNRSEFERRLELLVENLAPGRSHTLLYIDLDQFKVVNDTSGHAAGDQLLRQLSGLLPSDLRESDTLARLGGDEFGVLLEHCGAQDGQRVAEQILESISRLRFSWEDKTFAIGASIGLVELAGDGLTVATLLAAADTACYAAKEQGRNRVQAYGEGGTVVRRHGEMHWVSRINQAMDEERFQLYFQPIIPLQSDTDQMQHGEVLLRMLDEDGRVVPPGSFVPAAERYSLMRNIDSWVVERSLAWMATHDITCSINLSGQSVGDDRFLGFLIEQLRGSGVDPSRICFEITETAAIANFDKAIAFMHRLRDRGCRFALDDFGSGLSSFGYLKNLPVDFLKIDGVFVRQVDRNPIDHAMVAAINNIGHVMGIQTVAEFVESDAIRSRVKAMGVDFAQGCGIGEPRSVHDYVAPCATRAN